MEEQKRGGNGQRKGEEGGEKTGRGHREKTRDEGGGEGELGQIFRKEEGEGRKEGRQERKGVK